jgi:NNP family nitrate/nitrite transporter-like MFS transporter
MLDTLNLKSFRILFFNTLAFTVCFAVWVSNGVLVTYLVDNGIFNWSPSEMGWLMGLPILSGSIFRLPIGMLTDKYGGKRILFGILLFSAIPMYLTSFANDFWDFAITGFGFGMAGTAFAAGIANTSVWFPKSWQGRALGIFGVGNAGAAITTLLAPSILQNLTRHGVNLDNWRLMPQYYAASLVVMAILFFLFTENRKHTSQNRTLHELLRPLGEIRVWRFGLYYFLVFGCFVAFSQWLMPYFLNVYGVTLVTAGFLTSLFSLPSGVIRALGGWMADFWGARRVMYWVIVLSIVFSFFLSVPRMEIYSPGNGVLASKQGYITGVSVTSITVDGTAHALTPKPTGNDDYDEDFLVFPKKESWHIPIVQPGNNVLRKQLLAKGVTKIYFQANLWIYAVLVLIIGAIWGIGKAGVYRFIPDYYPDEVGVVGGMVGVIGGLGGFFGPIIFGYLLEWSGLWTSCWMLMLLLATVCFAWMSNTLRKMRNSSDITINQQSIL